MKQTRLATLCVALGLAAFFNSNSQAQTTNAFDTGANYSGGWGDGTNGGTGFGSWQILATGTGNRGAFIGDPASGGIAGMSAQSFGLYANPNNTTADITVNRTFSGGKLTNGQTFSLQWGFEKVS